jgi:DNA-binding MarR family transcriptional regulator
MPPSRRRRDRPDVQAELERTAAFRSELRRFLHRTASATAEAGLTPQRYDLLLMIKTAANRSEPATVGRLCRDLDLQQTAVTELVKRAEEAGLVTRRRSRDDGRVYELGLTGEGERRLMLVFDLLTNERHAFVDSFRELSERFHA